MARRIKLASVAGARPNFMKVAALTEALAPHSESVEHLLVHTGQHYDERMSGVFFDDLGLPRPEVDLGVGAGSHAEQTGRVMIALEPIVREFAPDLVIVVGDVNSTLAAALTAKKLGVAVAHVEAGLRSGDRTMPEEINRLATDAIADLLFTTDAIADANLRREGVPPERIRRVGNTMVDTLLRHLPRARALGQPARFGLAPRGYALVTLHRPANVDRREPQAALLDAFAEIARRLPVVFPVHPRTAERLRSFGLEDALQRPGVLALAPLGYLEFLGLVADAALVLTDSGGLQEETTALGVPCLTLRDSTERPITCSVGTNVLVGSDPVRVVAEARRALEEGRGAAAVPELWDGRAGERIVATLLAAFGQGRSATMP